MNAFSYVVGFIVLALIVGAGYFYIAKEAEAPEDTSSIEKIENTMDGGETDKKMPQGGTSEGTVPTGGGSASGGATGASNEALKPAAKTVTVNYSNNGYSPSSVDINLGDTVRWVSDGASMWTASALHPTHEVYPGFDQLKIGNTYEFTFTKAGSWKYHNHVSPNHFGGVNVK